MLGERNQGRKTARRFDALHARRGAASVSSADKFAGRTGSANERCWLSSLKPDKS